MIKWGPIGKITYERTYSRVKENGDNETWPETVIRTVDGNLSLVDKKYWRRNERADLIDLFLNFASLPAGRHLWVSGVKGRQFLFNCHVAGWLQKLSEHYAFLFDELMKGGGVGSNYSNRFIDGYGKVKTKVDLHVVCSESHRDYDRVTSAPNPLKDYLSNHYSYEWPGCIPIEDSREGWVDALVRLLEAAFGDGPQTLVIDVSRIRAYGERIRSFGGTASGPAALVHMLVSINELLADRINKRLSSLDHMTIDHFIARCVVAGNVRRSARMSVKYWKDADILDFIRCKTDDAKVKQWTTNISVEVDNSFFRAFKKGDEQALLIYEACIDSIMNGSEPGFWNSALSQHGEWVPVFSPNPCGEIILQMFENCNLGHINLGAFFDDPDGAKKAFMLMTRFLIRATFGDIYSPFQREVVNKNRRIGVGFFGFQDWLCKQGKKYSECHSDPEVISLLRQFYRVVKRTSMEYAHELRIPAPIKVTTLAPTGTIAKLAGTSEGGQAIYAKYYEYRQRRQKDDPRLGELLNDGVEIEECKNEEEGVNTVIIKYVCRHPLVDEVNELGYDAEDIVEGQLDISLDDTLAVQSMLQREWSDNAVSLTANLPKDITKKEIYHTIIKYLPKLKGTTVYIDEDREQPPYVRITKEEYEKFKGKKEIGQGDLSCAHSICPIK